MAASIFGYAGVLLVIWMAVRAMGLSSVTCSRRSWSVSTDNIFSARDGFKMGRVDTGAIGTPASLDVIDLSPFRYRTNEQFVSKTVSFYLAFASSTKQPVPILIDSRQPKPASGCLVNLRPESLHGWTRRSSNWTPGTVGSILPFAPFRVGRVLQSISLCGGPFLFFAAVCSHVIIISMVQGIST